MNKTENYQIKLENRKFTKEINENKKKVKLSNKISVYVLK